MLALAAIDYYLIIGYLFLTTWIGHRFKGKPSSTEDFFLGGRQIAWQAVTLSFVATTISAITLIAVPALIFAAGGNFTYLQFAIAGILARIIIARYLIPRYYEKNYLSPYDYVQARIGVTPSKVAAALFLVGGVLGQSVRVYATALVIEIMTGWSINDSIAIIAIFAVIWTWMGGIKSVIYTDVVQFCLLIGTALFVLAYIPLHLEGGWQGIFDTGRASGKLTLIDLSNDPRIAMTFWAALLAMPFQNVAVYGFDQLFVQRLLCCRSVQDAKKAILWSSLGEIIPLIMLLVGLGLYAFYLVDPLSGVQASLIAERADRILPLFIVSEIPAGLRGLMLAGILSAAISSLDSILAALAQVTYSLLKQSHARHLVTHYPLTTARSSIVIWGFMLAAIAALFDESGRNLIDLAFTMTTYTYGPLMALLILSLMGYRGRLYLASAIPTTLLFMIILNHPNLLSPLGIIMTGPVIAWPWLFPIGTLLTLMLGTRAWRRTEHAH